MREKRISTDQSDASAGGLADTLRNRTRALHLRAERSGTVREIVAGRVGLYEYSLYLRNLQEVYRCLERELDTHRHVGVRRLAHPALYRAAAIGQDLTALYGDERWARVLPLLPEGRWYGERIGKAAEGNGAMAVGHAYVRFLGDLNGGQIMGSVLRRSLRLDAQCLAFYDFPHIDDIAGFRVRYRQAVDRAGRDVGDVAAAISGAIDAFRLSIDLSIAVHNTVAACGHGNVGLGQSPSMA